MEVGSELVIPKEKIIVSKETTKAFAYCVQGDLPTLKIIVKNLILAQEKKRIKLYKGLLQ